MANDPDADLHDLAATIAVARLVLGPRMRLQAPPNLVGDEFALMLRAGIDDWGGVSPVTADHVNPERPWPAIDELAARSAEAGFTLRERLTGLPDVRAGRARRGSTRGCTRTSRRWPTRRPAWRARTRCRRAAVAGAGRRIRLLRPGRPEHRRSTPTGRTTTGAPTSRPSTATGTRCARARRPTSADAPGPRTAGRRRPCRAGLAASDPAALLDPRTPTPPWRCSSPRARRWRSWRRLADDLRRDVVGDEVTYVVNRNINFSNVCYVGCRFCAFAQRERDADAYRLSLDEVAARAVEAARAGATEVCMQGGIDPQLPVTFYADLVRAVEAAVPGMHVHAFSPMEIVSAAAKAGVSIEEWLTELRDAGLGSIPGTAAEILDDEVRWVLTKGKLPAAQWLEVVSTAHRLGIPSCSTMMYGHVDEPRHWLGHLRTLAALQDETGGFTEFVPLPFVHHNAPIYLAGLARPGPTERDNRAVHAFARLAAARADRPRPVLVGQARRRPGRGHPARRRRRHGRHADGGDDQPDGGLGERLGAHGHGADGDRGGGRPPGAAAQHDVPGAGGAAGPGRGPGRRRRAA